MCTSYAIGDTCENLKKKSVLTHQICRPNFPFSSSAITTHSFLPPYHSGATSAMSLTWASTALPARADRCESETFLTTSSISSAGFFSVRKNVRRILTKSGKRPNIFTRSEASLVITWARSRETVLTYHSLRHDEATVSLSVSVSVRWQTIALLSCTQQADGQTDRTPVLSGADAPTKFSAAFLASFSRILASSDGGIPFVAAFFGGAGTGDAAGLSGQRNYTMKPRRSSRRFQNQYQLEEPSNTSNTGNSGFVGVRFGGFLF